MHPLVKEIGQQRLLGRDADAAMLPRAVRIDTGVESLVLRCEAALLDDLALPIDCASLKAVRPCLPALSSVEPLSYIHYLTFSGIIGI